MQLTSTLSLFTLASLATAIKTFGVVTIRSGSSFQYASLSADSGKIYVGGNSGNELTFTLLDNNTLIDKSTGLYIYLNENNEFVESEKLDTKFSINNGYLTTGKTAFYPCPTDDKKYALKSVCDGSKTPVALKVVNEQDTPTTLTTKTATSTTTTKPKPTDEKPAEEKPAEAAPASDQKVKFGVISIHSGTQFQNQAIKKVDSHPHVFSVGGSEGSDISFVLSPDGTLVDQDGRGVYHDSNTGELGNVDPWGQQKPTPGFSIKDNHLVLDGHDNWKACPSGGDKFSLANNDCTGGTGIALHVIDPTNV